MTRTAIILTTILSASVALAEVKPLDPNSEEPLGQQINRAAGRLAPSTNPAARRKAEAAEAKSKRAAELDAKFATVEREVARLRALGEPGRARADALEREFQPVRALRDARGLIKGTEPQLHVVGLYEGLLPREVEAMRLAAATQAATQPRDPRQRRRERITDRGAAVVEVQATGRPIVLVLCAYDPVAWEVRVAKDADLRKVIISGYHEPTVTGIPAETPVEISSHDGGGAYFYTYGKESDEHAATLAKIRERTNLDPTTLLGMYRYPGEPLVVGPGEEEWVAQRVLADLDPLYRRAIAWELAKQRRDIANLRFTAVRFGGFPLRSALMSDFTPLGPLNDNDHQLPPGTIAATIDPADATIYALTQRQAIVRIDGKTQAETSITLSDPNLPRLTRSTAIAFDSKRRRLVVAAMAVPDVLLLAYDVDASKWSVLINLEGVMLNGLGYSAADDCFYGVPMALGRQGVVIRITPEGDANQIIITSRPIGSAEPGMSRESTQVIAVGDRLVLLPGPSGRASFPDPRRPPPPRECFVIDRRNGDVVHTGKLGVPLAEARQLTPEELDTAWADLSSDDAAAAERAIERLEAGRQQSIAFVREKLKPVPTTATPRPDAQRVAAWIADLNVDDARRRDAATRELRRLGREVEPALRDALKVSPSPEATTRLETLLAGLTADDGPRALDRDAYAAQLLARIGTPDAIELLGELSAGPADAPQTRGARRALQDFSRDE